MSRLGGHMWQWTPGLQIIRATLLISSNLTALMINAAWMLYSTGYVTKQVRTFLHSRVIIAIVTDLSLTTPFSLQRNLGMWLSGFVASMKKPTPEQVGYRSGGLNGMPIPSITSPGSMM